MIVRRVLASYCCFSQGGGATPRRISGGREESRREEKERMVKEREEWRWKETKGETEREERGREERTGEKGKKENERGEGEEGEGISQNISPRPPHPSQTLPTVVGEELAAVGRSGSVEEQLLG